jgi:SpoVK/Ycf46/Vps4 family AAA+-type ATPase
MSIHNISRADRNIIKFEEIHFSPQNKAILEQVFKEHRNIDALHQYGLTADHKILFYGASGCGKSTTARAIALQLKKPIVTLNLSTLISSKVGESSKNIKDLFDLAARQNAVLFLDEFDQLGKMRGTEDNDVGEMRRLVNSIIQLIDYLPNYVVLICATNFFELLDTAIVRRFQLKLKFEMPTTAELDVYYDDLLRPFPTRFQNLERKYQISYAEVKDYVHTGMKKRILDEL